MTTYVQPGVAGAVEALTPMQQTKIAFPVYYRQHKDRIDASPAFQTWHDAEVARLAPYHRIVARGMNRKQFAQQQFRELPLDEQLEWFAKGRIALRKRKRDQLDEPVPTRQYPTGTVKRIRPNECLVSRALVDAHTVGGTLGEAAMNTFRRDARHALQKHVKDGAVLTRSILRLADAFARPNQEVLAVLTHHLVAAHLGADLAEMVVAYLGRIRADAWAIPPVRVKRGRAPLKGRK